MPDRSCCVNCKHFNFYPGSRHYSELTPGSSMEIYCGRGHWGADTDTTEEEFRGYMCQSVECKDFKPVVA